MVDKNANSKNLTAEEAQEILRLANIIYFRQGVYQKTYWQGRETAKCPMDMWVYQELIHSLKVDLVIETGAYKGGSALYFAGVLEQQQRGKVISIDIELQDDLPEHPRLEFRQGSSIDPNVLSRLADDVAEASSVLVILDSDHKADYKLKEMQAYSDFVSKGGYLIAEDTCFDYYPAWPEYGPGPSTAVSQFLHQDRRFQLDRSQERHMVSFAPAGFLRRTDTNEA